MTSELRCSRLTTCLVGLLAVSGVGVRCSWDGAQKDLRAEGRDATELHTSEVHPVDSGQAELPASDLRDAASLDCEAKDRGDGPGDSGGLELHDADALDTIVQPCTGCQPDQVCTPDGQCAPVPELGQCAAGWCAVAGATYQYGHDPCTDCSQGGSSGGTMAYEPFTQTFPLLVSQTEVTQSWWTMVRGTNPAHFHGCDGCPVESVNWWEAAWFCNELSHRQGLTQCYDLQGCHGEVGGGCPQDRPLCLGDFRCADVAAFVPKGCDGYRLPTEPEWEFFARAGTASSTWLGDLSGCMLCDSDPLLDQIAWYCASSGGMTHPVAQLAPNPWGLYDVLGNVAELVDWGADPALPPDVVDPVPWGTGKFNRIHRTIRGGAFSMAPRHVNAWCRLGMSTNERYHQVGFRIVRSLPPP